MIATSAEGGLDRILADLFDNSDNRSKVMVEVGAAGPDFLSVGKLFRHLGWTVIAVEPNPVFAAAHRTAGNLVLEFAASSEDADDVDFFIVDSKRSNYYGGKVTYESFSSLGETNSMGVNLAAVPHVRTPIKVSTRKLDTLIQFGRINLLVVDVEGWELDVMRGLTANPDVVVLENHDDDKAYHDYMASRGYGLLRSTKPFANDIYVRKHHD